MPFNRLKAHIVGNRIRQWLMQNLGLVPLWLDPHIDPIAEFIVAEKEENVLNFPALFTMAASLFAAVGKEVNISEARTVALKAYNALPAGSTPKTGLVAILQAIEADALNVFPDKNFSTYETLLLDLAIRGLQAQTLFKATAEAEDEPFERAYAMACAA